MKALCFDSGDVDAIDSGGDDSKEEDEFVFVWLVLMMEKVVCLREKWKNEIINERTATNE